MNHQVIVIHGGDTPESYEQFLDELKKEEYGLESARKLKWRDTLEKRLGDDFSVYLLRMPNSENARYVEWKIWFDKVVPQIRKDAILIGHSLGGIFLAKYLSENKLPVSIKSTLLVAPPFSDDPDDKTIGGFMVPKNLDLFGKQGGQIVIYHSVDDPLVPFKDSEYYAARLPKAELRKFDGRGHFIVEDFPELVADIKALFNS